MPGSGLIESYLADLAAQLPTPIIAELADGLDQTYRHYRGQGLAPEAAAHAALAEFGEPRVVLAAFTQASPARRTARTLLVIGPLVGACWATVLITNRAWTWPVPQGARILLGMALLLVIGLLAIAAFSTRYRPAALAATAGCFGMTALDAALLLVIPLAVPSMIWPVIVAMAASVARITFIACNVRSVLTT